MRTVLGIIAFTLVSAAIFSLAASQAGAQSPPRPDPHPSACKKVKKKRCRAQIDPRPYRVVITWRVEDQDGNVSFLPGTCLRTKRGLEDCSITIRW